jgi:serine protease Do
MEEIQKDIKIENQTKNHKPLIAGILIISVLISIVFGSLFGFLAGGTVNLLFPKLAKKLHLNLPQSQENVAVNRQQIIEEDSAVIDVVQNASPAVVSIVITKDVPQFRSLFDNPFFLNPFDPFGSPQQDQQGGTQKQKIGGGSGFFVSSDGMIVTNRHVVEDAQAEYTVVTNDRKEYLAKIIARDPIRDIAVIKIEGSGFTVLNLGNSDNLKVGQTVIAIGNSLGEFANSVSKGIISGLKRNVTAGSGFGETERLTNIIQTDAAINPGNSGGPLLDVSGSVIGVNVAMAQGAENIGFALPINQVENAINQIKTKGKISVPFIGIRYVIIDQAIQQQNNLPLDYGALVIRGERAIDLAVIPGSPADKAGIVENDIILEIDGSKITAENQLGDLISKHNVDDVVALKVWHKGETKDVKVTLEERK